MAFLINKYLPQYTFNEYHEKTVNTSCKDCFIAVKGLDLRRSFITKNLMKLRGLPVSDLTLQGFIKNICFRYVEENLYNEFVIDASQPGLKIFWDFYFKAITGNTTLVSTETRILCLTKNSNRRFSFYWFFVKPFSGLIRHEMLRLIRKSVKV